MGWKKITAGLCNASLNMEVCACTAGLEMELVCEEYCTGCPELDILPDLWLHMWD